MIEPTRTPTPRSRRRASSRSVSMGGRGADRDGGRLADRQGRPWRLQRVGERKMRRPRVKELKRKGTGEGEMGGERGEGREMWPAVSSRSRLWTVDFCGQGSQDSLAADPEALDTEPVQRSARRESKISTLWSRECHSIELTFDSSSKQAWRAGFEDSQAPIQWNEIRRTTKSHLDHKVRDALL
jgi:hypothetical protein